MQRDLQDWLDYIARIHTKTMDLGLERVQILADHLHLFPLDSFVITVAGTNGKGSTVRFLENVLLNAGYSVAAYSSPHLLRFNERIRLNGAEVDDAALCEAFAAVEAARHGITSTFFEFTTLAALWIFKKSRPDFMILEVGLGGRLDAVNTVDTDLALITNIALDHCEQLGANREAIAYEKAGIMRSGKPVCFGEADVPAKLKQHAEILNAALFCLREHFSYHISEEAFYWENARQQYQFPKPHIHPANAALALQALNLLPPAFRISETAITQAVLSTHLHGRLQFFSTPAPTLLDVSHNPHAVRHLAQYIKNHYPKQRILAIFSVLNDKDLHEIIKAMEGVIAHWFTAALDTPRAMPVARIHQALLEHKAEVSVLDSIPLCYEKALQRMPTFDLLLVFGSFYTVADVLRQVQAGKA